MLTIILGAILGIIICTLILIKAQWGVEFDFIMVNLVSAMFGILLGLLVIVTSMHQTTEVVNTYDKTEYSVELINEGNFNILKDDEIILQVTDYQHLIKIDNDSYVVYNKLTITFEKPWGFGTEVNNKPSHGFRPIIVPMPIIT